MTKNYSLSDFSFTGKRVRFRGRALSSFDFAFIFKSRLSSYCS